MGMLSDVKKKELEEHLRTCKACQQEMKIAEMLSRDLATRVDPGDIESFIVSKVRLIKNIQPRSSWQYLLQIGGYVVTAVALLGTFLPRILDLIFIGESGFRSLLEHFPLMPSWLFGAFAVGVGLLFGLGSGLLTMRMLNERD
jgi:hypothetical protein